MCIQVVHPGDPRDARHCVLWSISPQVGRGTGNFLGRDCVTPAETLLRGAQDVEAIQVGPALATAKDMAGNTEHVWFESEVGACLPGLLATALRLTKNQADAEDLVAEALVKAWRCIDSLRDRTAFRGWMCRILTNTFLSQRRAEAGRPTSEPFEVETEESFSLFERLHQPFLLWQSNPEKDFLNRLLREDLACAIDRLPEVFRVVVVLVEVQGMSYLDVAETLDVPIGTVRSRLARGRSMLQKALWTQAVDVGLRSAGGEEPKEERDRS
jgi:RNA polymerase sigma-70 factor (ECF subfamily)